MPAAKKSFLNPTTSSLIIYFITVVVSTFAVIMVTNRTGNFLMFPITLFGIKVLLFFLIPFLLRKNDETMQKLEWIVEIVFVSSIVTLCIDGFFSSLASPLIEKSDIFSLGYVDVGKYKGLSNWVYLNIKTYQGLALLHFWVAFNSPLPYRRLWYCLKGEQ